VEVEATYHVLYVLVANGTLNINITLVYPCDNLMSSLSRLNMAVSMSLDYRYKTHESDNDVNRYIFRYVSDNQVYCREPQNNNNTQLWIKVSGEVMQQHN
jgi:hypothetical protein